jgi:nitroreductase
MDTKGLELIFRRRSIRAYKDTPVEPEKIELLLKAAMAAPSACNSQPWEIIVTTEEDILAEIREALPMARYPAPCAITVCGNTHLCRNTKSMWVQDCSAAMENLLLAATALDLGSVWIGVFGVEPFVKKVAKIMNLPDHIVPLGIAYVGEPAEEKAPRTQYDETRVYRGRYDPARKHRARPKDLKHR